MTKLLIIPDIHGRTFWKNATKTYQNDVDKIIFIGDYLDPYPWEEITRKNAIDNFQDIINYKIQNQDKVTLLTGNHDACYMDKYNFKRCSRYDSSNARHIEEMFRSHRSLFQLACEETINDKKYLFTHAGLILPWYNIHKNIIGELTVENLNSLLNSPQGIRALSEVSFYRWGPDQFGSIVWLDIHEMSNNEKQNIPWDYQIFGHTQQKENPIITDKWACIDCRKAFLLDENENLITIDE